MFDYFFEASNPFFWIALGSAIFFGWRSVFIFVKPKEDGKYGKKWDWWIYQIWFNSAGAFLGWMILWYFVEEITFKPTNIGHLAALIIAFLGITGNLPYAALVGRALGK